VIAILISNSARKPKERKGISIYLTDIHPKSRYSILTRYSRIMREENVLWKIYFPWLHWFVWYATKRRVAYFIAAKSPYALHFSWHLSNDTPSRCLFFSYFFNIIPNAFCAKNSPRQKSIVIRTSWLRGDTGCVRNA